MQEKRTYAWVAHVRVDTAVSTVCASSLLWCCNTNNNQSINVLLSIISTNFRRESHTLIDLDVLDDEVAGIEALGVGVGFGVLEETEEEVGGLDWPAGLGDAESLACVH